jgi:tRNA G18 (ribose-2'-O)-methylase SpoU
MRFPVPAQDAPGELCPACGAPTELVDAAWDPRSANEPGDARGPRLQALLDNVRSLRNVGSMFRTADGAGVEHLHLAGFTPTPKHPGLRKTALGAEAVVPWSRHADALVAARALADDGARLWVLEGGPSARLLFDAELLPMLDTTAPIVLVLGHEVAGVDPRLLDFAHQIVRIPMAGLKASLNVSVAFGIACYAIRHAWRLEATRADPLTSDGPRDPARTGARRR